MNLKPFNLERALAGDPVVTRSGRKVWEIVKLSKNVTYPFIIVLENDKTLLLKNTDDLFMTPTKKTYWVNVHKNNDSNEFGLSGLFLSREESIERKSCVWIGYHYHATVPIEIEE